jgi:hypothetical protein
MLYQITDFVNRLRRRNPSARTWRDYSFDMHHFARAMGDAPEFIQIRHLADCIKADLAYGRG